MLEDIHGYPHCVHSSSACANINALLAQMKYYTWNFCAASWTEGYRNKYTCPGEHKAGGIVVLSIKSDYNVMHVLRNIVQGYSYNYV